MANGQMTARERVPQASSRRARFPMRVLFVVATLLLALGCQGTEGDPIASGGAEVRSVSDCPSDYRVINGTKRNDVLFGTHGNDCILGQAGNDWIYGLGGDDYLAGGRGKDVLVGGLGADDLSGGPGHDVLFGGPGDDLIRGGADGDLVFAGIGDDIVRGGEETTRNGAHCLRCKDAEAGKTDKPTDRRR